MLLSIQMFMGIMSVYATDETKNEDPLRPNHNRVNLGNMHDNTVNAPQSFTSKRIMNPIFLSDDNIVYPRIISQARNEVPDNNSFKYPVFEENNMNVNALKNNAANDIHNDLRVVPSRQLVGIKDIAKGSLKEYIIQQTSQKNMKCENSIFKSFDFVLTSDPEGLVEVPGELCFYEGKSIECHNSMYITICNIEEIPEDVLNLYISIKPKRINYPISRVYSIFKNIATVEADGTGLFKRRVNLPKLGTTQYTIFAAPRSNVPENLIFYFTELGAVNELKVMEAELGGSDVLFYSDIFTESPLTSNETVDIVSPKKYKFPDNQSNSLFGIYEMLKGACTKPHIRKSDIVNMSISYEVSQIRNVLCTRLNTTCPESIDKKCLEYCRFVTSCIQVLSCFNECKEKMICEPSNYDCMNNKIIECANTLVKVDVNVSCMFESIFPPCSAPSVIIPEPCQNIIKGISVNVGTVIRGIPCRTKNDESSSTEKETNIPYIKKTEKKTPPSRSSNIGWYAGAGIIVVSVVVAVYAYMM